MILLLLSVSLVTMAAPMYAESLDSMAAPKAKTTTTILETNSTSVTEPTYGFIIKVDPSSHTIHHLKNGRSRTATYSVVVKALAEFRGNVELSIQGLPEYAEAFFNPEEGIPKPAFASILKIIVPPSTPAGVYTLNIIGSSGGSERYSTTVLIIEGEAVPPATIPKQKQLMIAVSTDQENYQKGDNVSISGYVKLGSGNSAEGATVSLNVVNETGAPIHAAVTQGDQWGRYSDTFALSMNAASGTYMVYATAHMTGYNDSYATVTFTVGVSLVPSVRIVNATITMLNGTSSSEFHPGETVVVWAAVNNTGADLINGNVWVETLYDPDQTPITLVVVVVTIHNGEQAKIGIHVMLGPEAELGTYVIRILVSDGPIMTGGKFLDTKEVAFIVTSSPSDTTTTTTEVTSETTSTSTSET
jgi:hypothetical protein